MTRRAKDVTGLSQIPKIWMPCFARKSEARSTKTEINSKSFEFRNSNFEFPRRARRGRRAFLAPRRLTREGDWSAKKCKCWHE